MEVGALHGRYARCRWPYDDLDRQRKSRSITEGDVTFASGEIDEDEYWRRLSALDEQFGRTGRGVEA